MHEQKQHIQERKQAISVDLTMLWSKLFVSARTQLSWLSRFWILIEPIYFLASFDQNNKIKSTRLIKYQRVAFIFFNPKQLTQTASSFLHFLAFSHHPNIIYHQRTHIAQTQKNTESKFNYLQTFPVKKTLRLKKWKERTYKASPLLSCNSQPKSNDIQDEHYNQQQLGCHGFKNSLTPQNSLSSLSLVCNLSICFSL